MAQSQIDYLRKAFKDGEHEIVEDTFSALLPFGITEDEMMSRWKTQQDPDYNEQPRSYFDVVAASLPFATAAILDDITGNRTPFAKCRDQWRSGLALGPREKDQYVRDVDLFGMEAGHFIEDITKAVVQKWVTDRIGLGDAIKTLQRRLSALRNYWGWLQHNGHADRERLLGQNPQCPGRASKDPAASARHLPSHRWDCYGRPVAKISHCKPSSPLRAIRVDVSRILCSLEVSGVNLKT